MRRFGDTIMVSRTHSCETEPDIHVSVHDHPLVWLIEDVTKSGRDVGEQSNGITQKVGRSQHSVDLSNELFLIVQNHTLLERCAVESDILEE